MFRSYHVCSEWALKKFEDESGMESCTVSLELLLSLILSLTNLVDMDALGFKVPKVWAQGLNEWVAKKNVLGLGRFTAAKREITDEQLAGVKDKLFAQARVKMRGLPSKLRGSVFQENEPLPFLQP